MKKTLCAALMLVASGAGCTRYFTNRYRDFADIFTANVSFGIGLDFNVQAGRFTQVGLGGYGDNIHKGMLDTHKFGFVGRQGWWWTESKYDINLVVPIWGYTYRICEEGNVRDKNAVEVPPPWSPSYKDENRGLLAVGGNAHLLLMGVEFYLDIGEFGDFVLGFFGIDLAQDDIAPPDLHDMKMLDPTIHAPDDDTREGAGSADLREREASEIDRYNPRRRRN